MADCLFCRLVRREIPATILHETEITLAFRDISPKAPVHFLVIPKEHIASVMKLEPHHAPLLSRIHEVIQQLARAEGIDEAGFRIAVNTGSESGQTVPHLHYHVLGKRRMTWPPG